MNSPYLVTAVIGAALVLLIIYRQMRTQPVEGRQLVVVPVVLALLGLYSLSNKLPATSAAVSALVASLVLAVVLGSGVAAACGCGRRQAAASCGRGACSRRPSVPRDCPADRYRCFRAARRRRAECHGRRTAPVLGRHAGGAEPGALDARSGTCRARWATQPKGAVERRPCGPESVPPGVLQEPRRCAQRWGR